MQKVKLFTLPNLLTSLNLFFGCLACVQAFEQNYSCSLLFIIASAVLDFFDGLAARALGQYSRVGLELDSLADNISFGLAPSLVAFSIFNEMDYLGFAAPLAGVLPFAAFAISVFSALRLAKFNVDERQATSFVGLPVPANALLWSSAAFAFHDFMVVINPAWLLCVVALSCYLLISELPMFSLKFTSLGLAGNKIRYLFIVLSLLAIAIAGAAGISVSIGLYIILSLLMHLTSKHDPV